MARYFIALVLAAVGIPVHLFGCSCVNNRAEAACSLMSTNEVMFVGLLVSAENAPEPLESKTAASQTGQARYTFSVQEAFSSGVPKIIDVYSGRGCCDCSVGFHVGEMYLVDGWRAKTGLVSASICSKTRLFRESDPLIRELRAVRDGKKPDSLFGVLRRSQEPWGGASDPKYNEPLGGCPVHLSSDERNYETTTDADGNYRFVGLPAGKYAVSADLPSHLVLGELILKGPMPPISVAENACGEVDLNALPTGRISGRIVSSNGDGVSGWDAAPLQLFRADRYKENARGWDDRGWWIFPKDGGYFTFDHVAPGDYVLVFNYGNSAVRSKYPLTFYPSAAEFQHATTIHVGDGEQVNEIVMRLGANSIHK